MDSQDSKEDKSEKRSIIINKTFVDSDLLPGRYRDSKLIGFVLRVTAKGTKTYCVDTRVKKSRQRVTYAIGIHGKGLTASEARKKAEYIINEYIKRGLNPHEEDDKKLKKLDLERTAEKVARLAGTHTLQSVLTDYLAKKKLKASTAYNYRCVIEANMADWLDMPLIEISRDMISQRHRKVSDKSPGMADNAMRVVRALFTFAGYEYEELSMHPAIAINPVRKLSQQKQWNKLARRQTVIKAHQLAAWYSAVQAVKDSDTARDYLTVILFTGLRKAEAESLRWVDVDLPGKQFCVRDTKNKIPLHLPLTNHLYKILLRRWQQREDDTWVFPGRGAEGHITDVSTTVQKVIKDSGVSFTLHDLRRTFVTIADGLGLGSYTIKKLVNHKDSADVTAGYFVADVERLRQPMEEISLFILKQVEQLPAHGAKRAKAKVVPIKSKDGKDGKTKSKKNTSKV